MNKTTKQSSADTHGEVEEHVTTITNCRTGAMDDKQFRATVRLNLEAYAATREERVRGEVAKELNIRIDHCADFEKRSKEPRVYKVAGNLLKEVLQALNPKP